MKKIYTIDLPARVIQKNIDAVRSKILHHPHPVDEQTLLTCLGYLYELNWRVKQPGCPISKSDFYRTKTNLLVYLVVAGYKYEVIDVQEDRDGNPLVLLQFRVAGTSVVFHQPLSNPWRWMLYDKVVGRIINPMEQSTPPNLLFIPDIDLYKLLLELIEANDWFIYEHITDSMDWANIVSSRYPELTVSKNVKMIIGPTINLHGVPVGRARYVRARFGELLDELDLRKKFKISMRKQ